MKGKAKLLIFVSLMTFGLISNYFKERKISRIMNETRAKYNIPAMGLGYFSKYDSEIYISGERKIGSGIPITENDKFQIGSCTKIFTATLFGIFVEQGIISLNTKLIDIFPEYLIHRNLEYVTMDMLLQHKSGITSNLEEQDRLEVVHHSNSVIEQRKYAVQKMLLMPPQRVSKFSHEYSNNGYILLGAVLEKISGKSWEELVQQYIFTPLHMTKSGFGPPGKNSSEITQPWPHAGDTEPEAINPNNTFDKIKHENDHFAVADNPEFYGPAATIHASIGDLITFCREQVSGAQGFSNKLLSAEMYEYLYSGNPITRNSFSSPDSDSAVFICHGSNTLNYTLISLNLNSGIGSIGVTNFAGKDFTPGISAIIETMEKIAKAERQKRR